MAKKKVQFFGINTVDRDIEQQSKSFEDVCKAIMQESPVDRGYELDDEQFMRLVRFDKVGDYYEGLIVKYRDNSVTTGEEDSDSLVEFPLESGKRATEVTLFVYSPETRIFSVLYNHSGLKHSHVVYYVNRMQDKFRMEPIAFMAEVLSHPDLLGEIRSKDYVKLLELRIPRDEIPTDTQRSDIFQAFSAAKNIGNAGTITIGVSGSRGRRDKTPLMSAEALATSVENGELDLGMFGRATVELVSELGNETINLLQNSIDSSFQVNGKITPDRHEEILTQVRTIYVANKSMLVRSLNETSEL